MVQTCVVHGIAMLDGEPSMEERSATYEGSSGVCTCAPPPIVCAKLDGARPVVPADPDVKPQPEPAVTDQPHPLVSLSVTIRSHTSLCAGGGRTKLPVCQP